MKTSGSLGKPTTRIKLMWWRETSDGRCVPPSWVTLQRNLVMLASRVMGALVTGTLVIQAGASWVAGSEGLYPRAGGWNRGDLKGRAFWIFLGFSICWLRRKAEHVEAPAQRT